MPRGQALIVNCLSRRYDVLQASKLKIYASQFRGGSGLRPPALV